MTALQTIEWENAQFDVDALDVDARPPDMRLTTTQVATWERICERVIELVGQAEREAFPSYVGIISVDPHVRLEYVGTSAFISIPYWYQGDEAVAAVRTGYAIGRIVEEETDLIGVDSQTTAGLDAKHLDMAVALYVGTRSSAVRTKGENK